MSDVRQVSRIAQILLSPRIGGAERLADSLQAEWRDAGVESQVIYLDPSDDGRSPLRRLAHLRSALRAFRPDAVVAHSALPNLYARLAAPFGVPVVCVLHSAGDDFTNRRLRVAERLLQLRTHRLVAVSDSQLETYLARFPRMTHRGAVIPNGIAAGLPSKVGYPPRPSTVATIARLAVQKNPQLWIDVAESLNSVRSELRLHWWGPAAGGESSSLLPRFEKLDCGEYHGPTDDVAAVLIRSDLLFHTADREAHSVALLEAASVGLPIVCSEAVAATLPAGLPFGRFKTGDALSAVQALERASREWEDAVRHAVKVRDFVRSAYSMPKCADAYLELLERPVTTRRAGGR